MRCSALLAAVVAAGVAGAADSPTPTSASTDATPVVDNPPGVSFAANLSYAEVGGLVGISSVNDGTGVIVVPAFDVLPTTGGPFAYHIHEFPVPTDGNCTGTGAHLDPFQRGDKPPCDTKNQETCQVGDLSGKHGAIPANTTSFIDRYIDLYVSTNPARSSYMGNRSLVIHAANSTRIACANFTRLLSNTTDPSNTPWSTPSPTAAPWSSGAAASVHAAGLAAGLVGALAVAMVSWL